MSNWIQGAIVSNGKLPPEENIVSWLEKKAPGYQFLLAHDDDGVIWGKVKPNQADDQNGATLTLARDTIPTSDRNDVVRLSLNQETLQQARLFGIKGELRLWRVGKGWRYAKVRDNDETKAKNLKREECYLLWGTDVVLAQDGFTLLEDGKEGLHHAPPLKSFSEGLCAVLKVCHYAEENKTTGFVRQQTSQLVGLETVKDKLKEVTA